MKIQNKTTVHPTYYYHIITNCFLMYLGVYPVPQAINHDFLKMFFNLFWNHCALAAGGGR